MKFNNPVSRALMHCYSNSVIYSVSCFMQDVCSYFVKYGTPHKTPILQQQKTDCQDTSLFIANELFELSK